MLKDWKYREAAYNGSGYFDETAYKAFKNLEKEDKMEGIPQRGDIWNVDTKAGEHREALVVAPYERYATVLLLADRAPTENSVMVRSRTAKFTDVGKLGYAYYDTFAGFVKSLPEDEFDSILRSICKVLGISPEKEEKYEIESLTASEVVTEERPTLEERLDEAMKECERLRGERDTYKEMFYKAVPLLRS